MKARRLIEGASFDPETLALGQAFDGAWASIADNFGSDATDIEEACLRLATATLLVAPEHGRDVGALKRAALEVVALTYRTKPSANGAVSH